MELHAFHREPAMPQTHDGACSIALGGVGTYFQIGRQGLLFDNQGMVTRRCHGRRQPAEDGFAVVLHRAGLAMHQVRRAHHSAPKRRADGLMSQTDPQQWYFACKMAYQRNGDSSFLRSARAGRKHDPFRTHGLHIRGRHLVIAPHFDLRTQLAQILHQVVGE